MSQKFLNQVNQIFKNDRKVKLLGNLKFDSSSDQKSDERMSN